MSYWVDSHSVDPKELEARFFINDDPVEFLERLLWRDEEDVEEVGHSLERVQEILEELPPREADFIRLYFLHHKTQTDIAAIYRVSQPTVCYRLQRATSRIRFILLLPTYSQEHLRQVMSSFLAEEDVNIMVHMYETTCQSEVAKRLGITQGKVRHRVLRAVRLMEKDERLVPYAKVYQLISTHLNILREIQRTSDAHRVEYVVD